MKVPNLSAHMGGRTYPTNRKGTVTSELSDLDEQKLGAIRRIAESIGRHQPVEREGLPGATCRNRVCAQKGTIFLTRADIHRHQAMVGVNDLLGSLRFDRILDLEEADVPVDAMEDDFTFSALTDLLDAVPEGRSYADRRARQQVLEERAAKAPMPTDEPSGHGDPRIAPAVNAFRREMYVRGVETSIGKVHASMLEAFAAADEASRRAEAK